MGGSGGDFRACFRHPIEVTQLVRVDHASDGLHRAIRDVQREHVHHVPIAIVGDRAGLPVRLDDPEAGLQVPDPAEQTLPVIR